MKGSYDRAGGPETLLELMLGAQKSRRWEARLVVLDKRRDPTEPDRRTTLDGLPHLSIPWRGIGSAGGAARRLGQLVRTEGASLLHTNDMRSDLTAWLLTRRVRFPWIAHVHGWLGPTHAGRFRLYEAVDRRLVRAANLVVVGSRAARKDVERTGAPRVRIVPNAVRVPAASALLGPAADVRAVLGIGADEVVAGVLGRLHPGKGQQVFVDALARLRDRGLRPRGLVVGEGPALAALRKRARESKLESSITFTGFVGDRWPYLAAMDIVVVPSLKESLPLTALEGMGLAKPVVASLVGDLETVVENGRSGLLVPPGSGEALAAALAVLLRSAETRRALGERGARIARERFSADSLVRGLDEAYEETLGAFGPRAGAARHDEHACSGH